jgi:hypothetical protein
MAPPILSGLAVLHSHFSTDFNIWAHFGLAKISTSLFQNNSIETGVNIQDGDFTFIYPSVRALHFRYFQTYNLKILDSYRKLYKN